MGIQINGNTNNINAGIGSLSIEDINELDIVGVVTAANFKTGTTNVHSAGIEIAGINVLGANTPIGVGATIFNSGGAIFAGTSGVVTATAFHGSGANLTSLPAQATIANNADNRVITGGSGVNLNGESTLTYDGTNLDLGDGKYVRLGASNDFQMWHNGGTGNTNIKQVTGHMYFYTGSDLNMLIRDGTSVDLYYANSKKFETTNTGVTVTGTVTSDGLVMSDSEEIQLGNSTDVRIFHDSNNTFFKNLTGDLILNSSSIYLNNAAQSATMLKATQGADVSLYHNGTQEFRTTSYGISIGENAAGSISGQAGIEIGKGHTTSEIRLKNTSGGSGSSDGFGVQKWSNGNTYIYEYDPNNFVIGTNGVSRWIIGGTSGNLIPYSNNTVDIGTAGTRVRNIYTNDLNLSNEGSTNSVDNTWGNYTIQEGESDLFLINNRSGKKYKFNLTEVS